MVSGLEVSESVLLLLLTSYEACAINDFLKRNKSQTEQDLKIVPVVVVLQFEHEYTKCAKVAKLLNVTVFFFSFILSSFSFCQADQGWKW